MPENTRATTAHTTGGDPPSLVLCGPFEVRQSCDSPLATLTPVPYEVSTPVFEGPFDLLLHLILKEEVDLWEISLARIVDAFCAEVERMQRVDLESATEFLLIAATLVELKARRLLPGRDDIELDEELMPLRGARPAARPPARLQDVPGRGEGAATTHLAEARPLGRAHAPGPEEPFRSLVPDPLERVSLDALLAAARSGLAAQARAPRSAPITSRRSARACATRWRRSSRCCRRRGAVRFRDLTLDITEKLEIIVRFLAVLELYKQGVIDLEQAESFGDLVVLPLAPGERVELDLVIDRGSRRRAHRARRRR